MPFSNFHGIPARIILSPHFYNLRHATFELSQDLNCVDVGRYTFGITWVFLEGLLLSDRADGNELGQLDLCIEGHLIARHKGLRIEAHRVCGGDCRRKTHEYDDAEMGKAL